MTERAAIQGRVFIIVHGQRWYSETSALADEARIKALEETLREILEAEQKRAVIPMGWVARARAALGQGAP